MANPFNNRAFNDYKAQQAAEARRAAMQPMADEVQRFTSTDPSTQLGLAQPGSVGEFAAARGADGKTYIVQNGAWTPDTSRAGFAAPVPSTGIQPAYPGASYGFDPVTGRDVPVTPQDQAAAAARLSQSRLNDLYGQVQGMQSSLTPEAIAGLQRNAFNAPYLQADGQERAGLAAQNGGGHLGGYGSAAAEAIRAGADVQRDANLAGLAADVGKYRDAFQTGKANLLHSIATSDPGFTNFDTLYTQGQNFANADRAFAADQANYATNRQDRLDQQANANQAGLVSGGLAAAGGLLSNPAVTGAAGALFGPVGSGIAYGAGLVTDAITKNLGLAKPPGVQGDAPGPTTAAAPRYGLASAPDAANKPYMTAGQPKRYGLFGGA